MLKKTILAASLLAGMALATMPAQAIELGGQNWSFSGVDNLSLSNVVPGGNQPLNIQCVICGDNQPQQQANFGYTNFHNNGSISSVQYFSSNIVGGGDPGLNTVGLPYDGSFLRAYLLATGDTSLNFSIGIDVNDNNTAQTLNSFFLLNLTQQTVLAAFTTPTDILSQNNGTGFPDYTLSGFDINIGTDIQAGDQLLFFASMSNMSDGPDSFFIVPAPVPGPIAGAGIPSLIAAFGMVGLAWRRRRARLAA